LERKFSVKFCTCGSIRIFFNGGVTLPSHPIQVWDQGMDVHSKGRIHILSQVSMFATIVAWKLWGEFAMHPAKKLLMRKMPVRLSIQEQNMTKQVSPASCNVGS
jgi:hypothetical protein